MKKSNQNKKRAMSAVMAFSLLLSLAGCSNSSKDYYNFIPSDASVEDCIDAVSKLTYLDEYLDKTNFKKLNDEYIKARKEKDINNINKWLYKLYELILQGNVLDSLISKGLIKSVDDVLNISIVKYENDKYLYCVVKYISDDLKTLDGNIDLFDSSVHNIKLKLNANIESDYNNMNEDDMSLSKSDEIYKKCINDLFKTGLISKNSIFSYSDDEAKKENFINEKVLKKESNN